jgi:hypothetical protein
VVDASVPDLNIYKHLHTHTYKHIHTHIKYIYTNQSHVRIAFYTFFSDLLRGVGDSIGSKGGPCDVSGYIDRYYTLGLLMYNIK